MTDVPAFDCQTTFLLYAQKDAFSAKLLPQNAILFPEIGDHLLLLPAHPAGKGHGK